MAWANRQRPQGAPLVYIDQKGVKDLQALQGEIKKLADAPARRKALNKRLSQRVKPIITDQRAAANGITFSSTENRGSRRAKRSAGVTKTGRARKGKGLRQQLASSIRLQVTQGKYAGIIIRQNSSDKDVNKIGRRLNYKGFIRHPLFGDKDHWYNTQTSNGVDWFWNPFNKRRGELRAAIKEVLDEELREVAKRINAL